MTDSITLPYLFTRYAPIHGQRNSHLKCGTFSFLLFKEMPLLSFKINCCYDRDKGVSDPSKSEGRRSAIWSKNEAQSSKAIEYLGRNIKPCDSCHCGAYSNEINRCSMPWPCVTNFFFFFYNIWSFSEPIETDCNLPFSHILSHSVTVNMCYSLEARLDLSYSHTYTRWNSVHHCCFAESEASGFRFQLCQSTWVI